MKIQHTNLVKSILHFISKTMIHNCIRKKNPVNWKTGRAPIEPPCQTGLIGPIHSPIKLEILSAGWSSHWQVANESNRLRATKSKA